MKVQKYNKSIIYAWVDRSSLDQTINELRQGREGVKLVKSCLSIAHDEFRDKTKDEISVLRLKKSGKGWRRTARKNGSYKKKLKVDNKKFKTHSGLNYAKANILRVSHLVERGFNHVRSGKKIAGLFFRQKAYAKNKDAVLKKLHANLLRGINILARTGKAPSIKDLRK